MDLSILLSSLLLSLIVFYIIFVFGIPCDRRDTKKPAISAIADSWNLVAACFL